MGGGRVLIEALEARTLLSAALSVTQISIPDGTELCVRGTPAADHITVRQAPNGLLLSNGGWSRRIPGAFQKIVIDGGAGNDSIAIDPSVHADCILKGGPGNNTLIGGSGNDQLYGGPGKNVLEAGGGDDTLVSLASRSATLIGGGGRDSFWLDPGPRQRIVNLRPDEAAAGNVHVVGALYGRAGSRGLPAITRSVRMTRVPEPATTDGSIYRSFSTYPLFSDAGPSPDDVVQGNVGDCYFLAVLSAVARTDPWRIRQSILDMGDGTYLVQFGRGNDKAFVRVDGKLPSIGGSSPDYAHLGAQGSLWVAIMEKAYAVFQGQSGYASIDGGWMDQAFAALGVASGDTFAAGPTDLLWQIHAELSAGQAVTYASGAPAAAAPLVPEHAYSVDSVLLDSTGTPISLRLRNPWGIDGVNLNPADHGYVTLTPQQAYVSMLGVVSAYV